MKRALTFTVAEPSDIIREGLAAVLHKINGEFRVLQLGDPGQLNHHLALEHPDVLIVNPSLLTGEGGVLRNGGHRDLMCVALLTGLRDMQNLQGFEHSVSVFDDFEQLREKLGKLEPSRQDVSDSGKTLSQREREIVSFVVKGYTNKQIADELCLSQHTVITHRRNIANKLQIHSSAGLTIYAIVNKLVTLEEVK
ncbi:MAG: LuxR C-terminal-related transcriptional regulator [Bacteroides sp.]|nr:LuxR C-terminal-related transcriptional regulator [Ruminococcus flavefaciens]MCM1555641.1 LuxR C-terminal-related transcriptional regulator [Bacteroides sp.]